MNETSQLVSIVIATYNGELYLSKQLESLFNQTYNNIEIIAIDDCSTDNTVEILQTEAVKHTNMKVFVNETNLGFIKNFEKGCRLSTGAFIAFCDQDDYWDETKIKKLVEAIDPYPAIYCDSFICDENLKPSGKRISSLVNCRTWDNCLQLAVFCRIYAHTMLIKRSFFNTAFPFLDVIPPDWWLPFQATFAAGIKYYPEALVHYRQHGGNVTGVIGQKRKGQKDLNAAERSKRDKYKIRRRVSAFYNDCPEELTHEKKVLLKLVKCYENFSLINNFRRCFLFFRYRYIFLSPKKHSSLHRFFFCFKMFVKIK